MDNNIHDLEKTILCKQESVKANSRKVAIMNMIKTRKLILALGFLCLAVCSVNLNAKTRCKLTKTEITLKKSEKYRLVLKGASSNKVRWISGNKKIASVNKGIIKAYTTGNVNIAARYKNKTYRCKVHVVALNKDKLTIASGSTYALKVKYGKKPVWTSSNSNVVTVAPNGVITAINSGKAVIRCKTGGRFLKATVYVPAISSEMMQLEAGQTSSLVVTNTGHYKSFLSDNNQVAEVSKAGKVVAKKIGTANIICKTGNARLACRLTVVLPSNITTPMSDLPSSSKVDRQKVEINSYPEKKTYIVYKQSGSTNKNSGKNGVPYNYMPNHGCAACSLATVLNGMGAGGFTPIDVTETVEKNVLGQEAWKKNYANPNKQVPLSLYGMTVIMDRYGIKNRYVRCFPGAEIAGDTQATAGAAKQEIVRHLKTGNPVVIEVSKTNWVTGKQDKKWSNSYHTMVVLGMTDTGKAILADPANRDGFGSQQRLKYVSMDEMVQYMFSCTKLTSTSVYWGGKSSGGGYILVNPQ